MALLKRMFCVFGIAALFSFAVFCLAGCGEEPAAKWAHGEVTEDEITTAVTNMRSYYSLTSDSDWATFVKERKYESDSDVSEGTTLEDANEKGENAEISQDRLGANIAEEVRNPESEKDESKPEGTATDLRSYMAEQLIRQDIVDYEVKEENITVSDEEVNEYVDQQRASVEAQYMKGVFESVLQKQGYANIDAFKDSVREQLAEQKLQEKVAGTAGEDGTVHVNNGTWKNWLDDKYANANVTINPATAALSYEIVETSESDANTQSESSNNDTQNEGSNNGQEGQEGK